MITHQTPQIAKLRLRLTFARGYAIITASAYHDRRHAAAYNAPIVNGSSVLRGIALQIVHRVAHPHKTRCLCEVWCVKSVGVFQHSGGFRFHYSIYRPKKQVQTQYIVLHDYTNLPP